MIGIIKSQALKCKCISPIIWNSINLVLVHKVLAIYSLFIVKNSFFGTRFHSSTLIISCAFLAGLALYTSTNWAIRHKIIKMLLLINVNIYTLRLYITVIIKQE